MNIKRWWWQWLWITVVTNSDPKNINVSWTIKVSMVVVLACLIVDQVENSVVWAKDHRRTDGVRFTCSHAISESYLQERDTSHIYIAWYPPVSCILWSSTHFSAKKLVLNIFIGFFLEEQSIILQALSNILKIQTCGIQVLLIQVRARNVGQRGWTKT